MLRIINKTGSVRRRNRGSAVLDAALVFPILLSLTFGAIEYGYYFCEEHASSAAREGCRSGIVLNNANSDVTTSVVGYLKAAGLNSSATTLDTKFTLLIESPLGTATTVSNLAQARLYM